jgi:uncharacterized protein
MAFLIAAISLGFLGGVHCIGMCGPIALALPVHQKPPLQMIVAILTYNFGRITTYASFGILFGLIGQSFVLFGFQQILSIVTGCLILSGLLFTRFFSTSAISGKIFKYLSWLKQTMAGQFKRRGISSFFTIGLLNGLLPCGMVYIALAGAVSTGSVYKGALFMAVFGLGTLPFMFTVTYFSNLLSLKLRNGLSKAVPVVIGIMAILLILRGTGLGIDYISPGMEKNVSSGNSGCADKLKCCHK